MCYHGLAAVQSARDNTLLMGVVEESKVYEMTPSGGVWYAGLPHAMRMVIVRPAAC